MVISQLLDVFSVHLHLVLWLKNTGLLMNLAEEEVEDGEDQVVGEVEGAVEAEEEEVVEEGDSIADLSIRMS